jgi:hypothetical protein
VDELAVVIEAVADVPGVRERLENGLPSAGFDGSARMSGTVTRTGIVVDGRPLVAETVTAPSYVPAAAPAGTRTSIQATRFSPSGTSVFWNAFRRWLSA